MPAPVIISDGNTTCNACVVSYVCVIGGFFSPIAGLANMAILMSLVNGA